MTDILFDPATAYEPSKQLVAEVIAHELAHQWFGNLVTMNWWNDLWLNEGFATFMSYLGTDSAFPNLNDSAQFGVETEMPALAVDALFSSHAIQPGAVVSSDDANSLFDAISYEKGASILRMLRYIMGDSVFFAGIHNYLLAFSYSNAASSDLYSYLRHAHLAVWRFSLAHPISAHFFGLFLQCCHRSSRPLYRHRRVHESVDDASGIPISPSH